MNIQNDTDLLNALLVATKPSEVRAILQAIGDSVEAVPNENLGSSNYNWRFFGDRESNLSTINLGSKPGRSLTERITNAIDAVLEGKKLTSASSTPKSPMDAAQKWFGRPASTADNGLFNFNYREDGYDNKVKVVLTLGDHKVAPSIDVIDSGIGISPDDFMKTILSLQAGNKIKKPYLAGAWGQGGSATLSFCEHALILSRHINQPDIVGFTVVKLMRLADSYKEDAYVYLSKSDGNTPRIPRCSISDSLDLYPSLSDSKMERLLSGTVVRHYGYNLTGLESTLGPSPGNLYHLFQYMMFDPLIPFRVFDLRPTDGSKRKNEIILGSRNRLMKLVSKKADVEPSDAEEPGTELKYFAPREWISPGSDEGPDIGFEYWVVLNRRKSGEKTILRGDSNELFLEKGKPILCTMNGQNQGELTARILRELNLSMVSHHIVIHLDATRASRDVRGNLFASTREAFRDSTVLQEITRVITNILRDDTTLQEIERELLESMLKSGTTEAKNEVRLEITSLLRDAGFEVKDVGNSVVAAGEGKVVVAPPRPYSPPIKRPDPIPSLPYPQVTFFKIVFPTGILSVPQLDNQIIRVETDAEFRFDRDKQIHIRFEADNLEVASKGNLSGGRMHWRVRPKEGAKVGDKGLIIVSLTKPDGAQIVSQLPYEILPPREEPAKNSKGQVPSFNIIGVEPDTESFKSVWDDDATGGEAGSVAYRAMPVAGGINVYYSKGFTPFKAQLEKLKNDPVLLNLFDQNYQVWIGYHAIIQHQHRKTLDSASSVGIDSDSMDVVQEHERAVVAEMQIKQAIKMAELQRQALKHKGFD